MDAAVWRRLARRATVALIVMVSACSTDETPRVNAEGTCRSAQIAESVAAEQAAKRVLGTLDYNIRRQDSCAAIGVADGALRIAVFDWQTTRQGYHFFSTRGWSREGYWTMSPDGRYRAGIQSGKGADGDVSYAEILMKPAAVTANYP